MTLKTWRLVEPLGKFQFIVRQCRITHIFVNLWSTVSRDQIQDIVQLKLTYCLAI